MISLKDIAERCGVSVATVSKALNGHKDIGADTRERITQMAEEMGYMSNSAARALKTNRTYNIGILFIDERDSGLSHEFFSSVLDSLKVEAERNGYDVTFINRNVGKRETTYLQHCRYRNVDGVVIACVDFEDPQVQELVASDVPVVTIDHVFHDHIAVLSDNVEGMEALVRYAYDMGHRRLAMIHGETTSVTRNRIVGFNRACEALGLQIPEEYIRAGNFHDTENCYEQTKALLALDVPPTCIFFPDDYSCIGGINAVQDLGMSIPEDVSAIGYDGIRLSRVIKPSLVTYKQNTLEMGRTAAKKLIELIETPRTVIRDRIIIHGEVQEGNSVRRL